MGCSQRISAGITILVDRATAPLIKDHGTLIEGRDQFITLQSPDNGRLIIVNIYAPRTSNERALLWRKISQAEFSLDHVILGGDFNHLEVTDHRGTSGTRQMHRREVASWHHMTLRYGLANAWHLDNFHKMSEKEFTFNNGRACKTSAISRIDKLMISQTIDERGGRIEVAASMRKFTDHLTRSYLLNPLEDSTM